MSSDAPAPDFRQYAQLRTILDSLETGALRFYLSAGTEKERNERFKYIKTNLTPIIDYLWQKEREDTCPPGYHNCDGYCVSYPCIGGPAGDDRY